jgi:2-amino-4-hydroxy-6-hydroxymethyldihydropteridine diphosphokinase
MTAPLAYLALGSNLGDRVAQLRGALDGIAAIDGVTVEASTSPMVTPPLDGSDQPSYLNAMVRVRCTASPEALLAACHALEARAGRERRTRWAARTLDIDLVRHGATLCDRPDLTLPHPGLRDRHFWAVQLAELETDA